MLKRLVALFTVGALGMLLWSAPVQAQEPDVVIGQTGIITNSWQTEDSHLPVASWVVNGQSRVENATTVVLQDHVTGDTSVENPSVGLNVQSGAVVSVKYQLVDDDAGEATCQAGEPRLFAFINSAINKSNLCDGTGNDADSGILSFEAASSGLVTQVGMVYSRDTGHVIMENLTIDGTLVLFQEPEPEPEPTSSPSPDPTATATMEPTPTPTTSSSTEPVAEEKPQLPQTGSGWFYLVGIGLILLAAGTAAFGLSKLRARQ